MGRRPRWQAVVELPSLWFGLQLVELVIAVGLLLAVVPDSWSRLERLASALVVYALLTVFNYVLIARSHPKPGPADDDVIVVPEAAERTDESTDEHTRS